MQTIFSRSILAGLVFGLLVGTAQADAGHDHGHDHGPEPVARNDGPKRLPDGSVFLPKLSQRQLAIRTVIAERKELPKAFELAGKVVMDPNAGGKVQPTVAGRIEPGPKGLPSLGQAVRKGEVLAYLRPSTGTLERANQRAQAAELRATKTLAQKRLARLKQLEGTVPQREIDAAEADVRSMTEKLEAVGASLSAAEVLAAPVSGVIATANAVAGQVVDAREILFEIVDPDRLRIEAVAHDAAMTGDIASAAARIASGETIPLEFAGAGMTLREQALPVHFRTPGSPAKKLPPLAVGQPVKVVVQSKTTVPGVAIPASAIVKSPANQDVVWIHDTAERFTQRAIRHVPLDANSVTVIDGLADGERVVVQGASLVNQVR